ncbi:phage shock envelope stress response protein PspM [Saccharomonospora saliphila]|uniref:phage shock envelope stress response protein PspM n=1 Tax=Saccharomonospora saliphila TaxID=369829 RepID=UPI0003824C7D|nr:hypothetical protein [Saccharomonospora saliphila]
MSGGRDFNELGAKLEKTVRRLPDYAQRAQQQLQKYTGDGQADDRRRSGDTRPSSPPEPAVVAEIRDKWARWNDPAAKLERRRRRTSRALTLWTVATLLSVLWAVVGYLGVTGISDGIEGAFTGIAATLVFGTLGVRTGLRLRRLNRTPLPERPSTPPALPAPGSAAREPMELLQRSEESLADLLTQLETPHGGSTSVPEFSVADARATATEAAAALRALAVRIESIERARESAPDDERRTLDAAVEKLRGQLDDGMDEYGTLVAAAGRAVAASSSGIQPARQALTDATDRLAGLASALRELSGER